MVVVDHGLSKGVILTPCSSTIDVAGIAQLFFNLVFKRFGLRDTLISECGPQFAFAFAKELAQLLKYDVCLSTTYHPQTDRQTVMLGLGRDKCRLKSSLLGSRELARQVLEQLVNLPRGCAC